MSEGLAHDQQASSPTSRRPAYGDGRLTYDPPRPIEGLARRDELIVAMAIVTPVVAAYAAVAYAIYAIAGRLF